ncbi:MAG: hypothetical protein BJ554DRAFT_580 [Olpidium bornovanus]|uniref:Uncharacterized protein n=1 Tax=Olpidium bornovanus TaxID=278681 RepID=A0A8H7ZTJ2_9FUNG|nr:MAG: hypothetical protein BJ554DRAFT_580 [Olpidium bornovanus]
MIYCAADRVGGSKKLLDSAGKLAGQRLVSHLAGGFDDLVESQVAIVLDCTCTEAEQALAQEHRGDTPGEWILAPRLDTKGTHYSSPFCGPEGALSSL